MPLRIIGNNPFMHIGGAHPALAIGGGYPYQYSIDFSGHADGALPSPLAGSAWSLVSGVAKCTPTLGVQELALNGSFASGANWNASGGWSIGGGVATHAAGSAGNLTQNVLISGALHSCTFTANKTAGTATLPAIYIGAGAGNPFGTPVVSGVGTYTVSGWQVPAGDTIFRIADTVGDLACTIDDVSIKQIILSSTLAGMKFSRPNMDVSASVSRIQANYVGVFCNVDSLSAPLNGVLCYENGNGKVNLDKIVNGVRSNVATITVTYGAGRIVRVTQSGTTYTVYYNGAQIGGTTYTISDAGIISNTYAGLFSTGPGNTILSFATQPTGST